MRQPFTSNNRAQSVPASGQRENSKVMERDISFRDICPILTYTGKMNTLILYAVASVVGAVFYEYCEYRRKIDDDSKNKNLTFPVKSLNY